MTSSSCISAQPLPSEPSSQVRDGVKGVMGAITKEVGVSAVTEQMGVAAVMEVLSKRN